MSVCGCLHTCAYVRLFVSPCPLFPFSAACAKGCVRGTVCFCQTCTAELCKVMSERVRWYCSCLAEAQKQPFAAWIECSNTFRACRMFPSFFLLLGSVGAYHGCEEAQTEIAELKAIIEQLQSELLACQQGCSGKMRVRRFGSEGRRGPLVQIYTPLHNTHAHSLHTQSTTTASTMSNNTEATTS